MNSAHHNNAGFTLVEMAIVLVIVGLLLGGLLMPLSTQMEQKRIGETEKYIEQIKEALLGYATANGRLPCPATATSNGLENPVGGGVCTNPYNGFLPAVTLGLSPLNNAGLAIDAWNTPIRYAVTTANGSTYTTAGGMRATTLTTLAATTPLLSVCASATGITATTCGPTAANTLANKAPVIIYSLGKNAAAGGTGIDETANPNPNSANNDQVFVWHVPAQSTATNGEFDDIVTWISLNTMFSRMIAAGALP